MSYSEKLTISVVILAYNCERYITRRPIYPLLDFGGSYCYTSIYQACFEELIIWNSMQRIQIERY